MATAWILTAAQAGASERIAVLQLDEHSFISFSPSLNPPLPPGSAIRFRFGASAPDGSIEVKVEPEDVSIAPVRLEHGGAIEYRLARTAVGRVWKEGGGLQMEFSATLVATLRGDASPPPAVHELRFTTGSAEATNAENTDAIVIAGAAAGASRHVRLVAAATHGPDAFPGPGEAVYAVLSGSFDWLPDLPGS